MFREMRKKEMQMDKELAMKIVEEGKYGILSTIGENGYPYGVPVNYVYLNDSIYIHCATEGHKLDNIEYSEKVSFCIVNEAKILPEKFDMRYRSVIIFGKAKEVEKEEKKKVLLALIHKYSKDYLTSGERYINNGFEKVKVIGINIDDIKGKTSN